MVKVFLTGGTGFIGSRVAKALVAEGHDVTALSRRLGTELEQLNVKIVQGSLKDLDVIAAAAAEADAVLHLGFEHDFARFKECCEQDVAVVKVIVKALSGSGKLFVNTNGLGSFGDSGDALGKEDQALQGPRAESAAIALKANEDGIRGVVMVLPAFVYAKGFSFFYHVMYKAAEKKGSASYIGAGDNKLCVLHVDDAARAYMALLTHKEAHGIYSVPGQNHVTSRDIAEIIASKLQCKAESVTLQEAQQLFGPVIAMVTSMNLQADGTKIQQDLDWKPQYIDIKHEI